MRWLREVRVVIGDGSGALSIQDLLITFRVRRESTETPVQGEIAIANLKASNERYVRERGARVQLFAGHQGRSGLLLDGAVRRVSRRRDRLDRFTVIHIGGDEEIRGAFFNRTYAGSVSVRTIVRDIISSFTGLSAGPLDLIPAGAAVDDWSYAGPSRTALTELIDPLGIRWYEENRVIRFTNKASITPGAPLPVTPTTTGKIHVISEATGMVESPTVTEDGIRVRIILNPFVNLDDLVDIRSIVTEQEALGRQKIVVINHHGDNRTGDFFTELEIRSLEDAA